MTVHVPTLQVHGRRLVDVARPAAGRPHQHQVGLATVGGWPADSWSVADACREVAVDLARATGPARCSAITVEVCWSDEEALAALWRPPFAEVSVDRIDSALAGYRATLSTFGRAAFLLARCCVLWPQTESSPRWNTS